DRAAVIADVDNLDGHRVAAGIGRAAGQDADLLRPQCQQHRRPRCAPGAAIAMDDRRLAAPADGAVAVPADDLEVEEVALAEEARDELRGRLLVELARSADLHQPAAI